MYIFSTVSLRWARVGEILQGEETTMLTISYLTSVGQDLYFAKTESTMGAMWGLYRLSTETLAWTRLDDVTGAPTWVLPPFVTASGNQEDFYVITDRPQSSGPGESRGGGRGQGRKDRPRCSDKNFCQRVVREGRARTVPVTQISGGACSPDESWISTSVGMRWCLQRHIRTPCLHESRCINRVRGLSRWKPDCLAVGSDLAFAQIGRASGFDIRLRPFFQVLHDTITDVDKAR